MDAEEEDDDRPTLSAEAVAALQEFYDELKMQQQTVQDDQLGTNKSYLHSVKEDWQLSQFWYDNDTANILAKEAIRLAGSDGRIACISCPTVFQKLMDDKPEGISIKLFEYDRRFEVYGSDFIFYDYNKPLDIDEHLNKSFDVVVADPPFLSEECLEKTAKTIKMLAKDKIILCTGSIMEELVDRYLGLKPCAFQPKHIRKLGNEFNCYTNFEFSHISS